MSMPPYNVPLFVVPLKWVSVGCVSVETKFSFLDFFDHAMQST